MKNDQFFCLSDQCRTLEQKPARHAVNSQVICGFIDFSYDNWTFELKVFIYEEYSTAVSQIYISAKT